MGLDISKTIIDPENIIDWFFKDIKLRKALDNVMFAGVIFKDTDKYVMIKDTRIDEGVKITFAEVEVDEQTNITKDTGKEFIADISYFNKLERTGWKVPLFYEEVGEGD